MGRLKALLTRQKTVAAGVVGAMVLLGVVLYPSLPGQMAILWIGPGEAESTTAKPVAILLLPAIVLFMSVLFEVTRIDAEQRVVGSLGMLLLLVVQVMILMINLGIDVPIVPVALAGGLGLALLAVWFEVR